MGLAHEIFFANESHEFNDCRDFGPLSLAFVKIRATEQVAILVIEYATLQHRREMPIFTREMHYCASTHKKNTI